VAKKAVGDYLHYYEVVHGLDYTVLALANVYGPRQDPFGEAGVVAIFARRLLDGEQVMIYGDGHQTRDFVYVGDVVDAFSRAKEPGVATGLVVNVGTGVETTVNELFATMAGLTGTATEAVHAPARTGELIRSALDPRLAATELDWRPATALEDGLSATLDWFRSRPPAPRPAAV